MGEASSAGAAKKTISFMVPVLNEEANLERAVAEIHAGASGRVEDYELLIFDDGSTDRTGAIADRLAAEDPRIRAVHHRSPQGIGFCYRAGLALARFDHYMYVPGDNEVPRSAVENMLDHLGEADILVHYVTNMRVRSLPRQALSVTFTKLLNTLFGLDLAYFNGINIHRVSLLKTMPLATDGHACQAELLIHLIKGGATYREVPCQMVERTGGKTAAFRVKNVVSVGQMVTSLFWEVQVKPRLFDRDVNGRRKV